MTGSTGRSRSGLQGGDATGLQLRVLATTDLHGYLTGYDYIADRPSVEVGLTRVASLIAAARAEAGNTLLFDNGDFLQGTPLTDGWPRRHSGPHPMIAAMNALDYDAATPGNHEFNFGLDVALEAFSQATFPLVSANALHPDGQTLLPPWIVLRRRLRDEAGGEHDLRIGVIGFLPPQTVQWDRALLAGRMTTQGIAEAARARLPELRAAGADIVIALAHTGIDPAVAPDAPGECIEQAALPLARVGGIDLMILGHSHETFPGTGAPTGPGIDATRGRLHGVPAMMPGRWGSHLGIADLRLERRAGRWSVADCTVALRPVARRAAPGVVEPLAPENAGLRCLCAPAHARTLRRIRRVLGQTETPIDSFFSLVAPDAGLGLIAAAQAAHVRARLARRPEAALPILSAVAPFRCGGRGGPTAFTDIPAGPLRQKHIADLYVFPNAVAAVRVSGAQIRDWLERAAGAFAQIVPGRADQPLRHPGFPCYNFDILHGLTYTIDLTNPARFAPDGSLAAPHSHRIGNLRFAGAPLAPEAAFVVATNSYRASGAGGLAEAALENLSLGRSATVQELLARTIRGAGRIAPRAKPVWRFAPISGASAFFDTAPQARLDGATLRGLLLESVGTTAEGFQRIRLHF